MNNISPDYRYRLITNKKVLHAETDIFLRKTKIDDHISRQKNKGRDRWRKRNKNKEDKKREESQECRLIVVKKALREDKEYLLTCKK